MREQVITNLSVALPRDLADELFSSYEGMIRKFHAADYESCLNRAGKFVEQALRCLESIRTGAAPKEIKSISNTINNLKTAANLNESVSTLIPRIVSAMIYDVRSKKGAVHVKGIDPSSLDATLAISAASWVISELLRLYHTANDNAVQMYVSSLMRAKVPYIETISNEVIVTRKVPATVEVALLLSTQSGDGVTRSELGKRAQCSPASVTKSLTKLKSERLAHQTAGGSYFLTGAGEAFLAKWLVDQRLA